MKRIKITEVATLYRMWKLDGELFSVAMDTLDKAFEELGRPKDATVTFGEDGDIYVEYTRPETNEEFALRKRELSAKRRNARRRAKIKKLKQIPDPHLEQIKLLVQKIGG